MTLNAAAFAGICDPVVIPGPPQLQGSDAKGAAFLRRDGGAWSTDKDGLIMAFARRRDERTWTGCAQHASSDAGSLTSGWPTRRFRYLTTYFSRSPDGTCTATVGMVA